MIEYKRNTIIDGKYKCVIVDKNGNIKNRNPRKEELKHLCEEPYLQTHPKHYTNKELLDYPIQFYKKYRKVPTERDFYNIGYATINTYIKRFGSWSNTLKLVGLDVDSMVKNGVIETDNQKARLWELLIIEIFDNKSIDLSGNNWCNPYDGICPNGKIYDAKSSKLGNEGKYFDFYAKHKDKDDSKEAIEYYYLGAFNEDYTKLLFVWRVPGEIVEKYHFTVGMNNSYEFNIENMKKYDITDKFKYIIMNRDNEMFKKLFN